MKWGGSLSNEQRAARGKPNLPFLAHMLDELDMGGRLGATVYRRVFECGNTGRASVYPQHLCPDPELGPRKLLTHVKYRIRARAA